jgi:hypothetical protein
LTIVQTYLTNGDVIACPIIPKFSLFGGLVFIVSLSLSASFSQLARGGEMGRTLLYFPESRVSETLFLSIPRSRVSEALLFGWET